MWDLFLARLPVEARFFLLSLPLCFLGLFVASGRLLPSILPRGDWARLDEGLRIRARIKAVSLVHTLVVIVTSISVMLTEPEPSPGEASFLGTNTARSLSLGITLAYMVYDLLISLYYWRFMPDKSLVYHHTCTILSYGVSLCQVYPLASRWQVAYQAIELTTPLVAARWYLLVTGRAGSKLYFYNGLAMLVGFFLVRVCWSSRVVWGVLSETPWTHERTELPLVQWVACIAFTLVQYYWFALIVKGAIAHKKEKKEGGAGEKKAAKDLYRES